MSTEVRTVNKDNEANVQRVERREAVVLSPAVDILETEKDVLLLADMPGVNEKNVDIDLHGNSLTIKGHRETPVPAGMELIRTEYQPDYRYERQFTMGDTIDREKITAVMKDGVLRLTLPKIKELAPRRIEVKAC
ncbi:Hsp20/alpha crystallin family protein [Oligosphaera ethanolica]|uniref:HSP20 family protein n=1 Tax=Oligosphaera ethanolica TaxID=760260 RepID=A0AAE3VDI5_9BACT|nr:Hsp20/alpha crystallin family protein [Oligosphaera ethanolica]MDQ0288509.1 HSP20 family protein [Oligosphaera ethanolica]